MRSFVGVVGALAFGLVALALAATEASANSCNLYNPQSTSFEIPLGCPVQIYAHRDAGVGELRAFARDERTGGFEIDVTGDVTRTESTLVVGFYLYEDRISCRQYFVERDEPFTIHTIELAGVEVGDDVSIDGTGTIVAIVPAGACPTTVPAFACSEPICTPEGGYDYGDDDVELGFGAGCSAAGDASPLGLFAVGLALTIRRRRSGS